MAHTVITLVTLLRVIANSVIRDLYVTVVDSRNPMESVQPGISVEAVPKLTSLMMQELQVLLVLLVITVLREQVRFLRMTITFFFKKK